MHRTPERRWTLAELCCCASGPSGRAIRAGGDEVREDLLREVRRRVGVTHGGVDDHGAPDEMDDASPVEPRGQVERGNRLGSTWQ